MNPNFYEPKCSICYGRKWNLLLTFLLFIFAGISQLYALNPGAVKITNKSGPSFYLDHNKPCVEGPGASYVAYEICNNTNSSLANLTASLTGLASGFVLHNGQLATQSLGTLNAGQCKMVFWYVKYPCSSNKKTNITITVTDNLPGVVSATNEVKTASILSANAGGRILGATLGPKASLGEYSWLDAEYSFGNIPKNGIAYFQPAGNLDFNAGCLQLTGFEVLSSNIPAIIPVGSGKQIYFTAPSAAGGGSHKVMVRYHFQVQCSSYETAFKPYAAATSGNPVKYSDNFGSVKIDVTAAILAAKECNNSDDQSFVQLVGTGCGLEGDEDNWSVSWGDYNNDGLPDLFLTTHEHDEPNSLYRNLGNGQFERIKTGSIATDKASSLASTWGDYDNDGDLDLFVANNIGFPNFLYRNEGNDNFVSIQDDPVVSDLGYAHGASWVDYDNDRFLDLFVGSFFETYYNQLYHNNGDGTFSKVSNNPVVDEASATVTGVWGDYNNDGYPDLFVVNTRGYNNSLYKNTGKGTFEKITGGAIVNDGGSSVGASWGDYDNDGDLDLFVANAGDEDNFLYQNNGDGTFKKIEHSIVVKDGGHSHGSAWVDYDNDGDLDLFVANDGQDNFLYRNEGHGKFIKIYEGPVVRSDGKSFGCAWADLEGDGDLDLFVANREKTANLLFQNDGNKCRNYIGIALVSKLSNKRAIGAKIHVKAVIDDEDVWQMREITSQSGGGTGGQNEMKATFGLGDATIIDSILIEWPSGYKQVLTHQLVNQQMILSEDEGAIVCGRVYHDANGDCTWNPGEYTIPNAKIVLQPGNITTYTDESGNYELIVALGTYGIELITGANWAPVCPNSNGTAAVKVTNASQSFCGFDFGNKAICTNPDLKTSVIVTAHRVGFENLMVVNYENAGIETATDVTLSIDVDDQVDLMESSLAWDKDNQSQKIWTLEELKPGSKGAIYLKYKIDEKTEIGKELLVKSELTCSNEDCNNENNVFLEKSLSIGALDPNDILVSPEGLVSKDEYLHYKIRFQNVGNAPVATVRVEDQLPEGLDFATLEMGTVSHGYQFQAQGNRLVWTFPNINLPDSVRNEPQSHGFITFRIKPKQELRAGDKIVNSAVIYFDHQAGIVTNEVLNIIRGAGRGNSIQANALDIFPNPSNGEVSVTFNHTVAVQNPDFLLLTVYDMQGKPILIKSGALGNRPTIDLRQFPDGHYLLQGLDQQGKLYTGKIVLLK